MNAVKVNYNPYLPELKIELNGKLLPEYSSLLEHRHRPFVEWCASFFTEIKSEVNDTYELSLCATDFEREIFEKLSGKDSKCGGFCFDYPMMNRDIIERLDELESLGDVDDPTPLNVGIWAENDALVDGMFEILLESGMFQELSEGTLLSEDYPLVSVFVRKMWSAAELSDADMGIVLTDGTVSDVILDEISYVSDVLFVMQFSTETAFVEKRGQVMIYDVDGYDLTDQLANFLAGVSLPMILSERSFRMTQLAASGEIFLSQEERERLELVCATQPVFRVSMEERMDVGRVYEASVSCLPGDMVYTYRLEARHGRMKMNGMQMLPEAPGVEEVAVYVEGRDTPISVNRVDIGVSAYIQEIQVRPKVKYIGLGDTENLAIRFLPEDAENLDEIQVEYGEEGIAVLNRYDLTGLNSGQTDIRLFTREAQAEFRVIVQPHLERIDAVSMVEVAVGAEVPWSYTLVPEECFEKERVRVTSSDETVAIYRGGYILGKRVGTAKIYISAPGCDAEIQCQVVVTKGRHFR